MINQKGLGLPEVMVSLFLTGFILIALMSAYMHTRQQDQTLQLFLNQDMELLLVTDAIRDSIQQAGFTPCSNINYLVRNKNLNAIQIQAGLQSALRINRMSPQFEQVLQILDSTHMMTTSRATAPTKSPILIADCYHAEVHHVKTKMLTQEGQRLTFEEPLVYQYQPPVFIGEWISEQFFTRARGGLFYERIHRDELTSLVQTMQLDRETNLDKTLVRVRLGLPSRVLDFQTRVRS